MKGMDELLRQAQMMQGKMAKIQQDLAGMTVHGTSGGGMVKAVATGKQDILSISIDKTVIDPADPEMLQDLVTAAVNDALRASREMAEKEMAALTGGFNIPGLM